MKNYICNGEKFFFNKGYICLNVEINNLPEKFSINGHNLYSKSSFHTSLLCVKNIVENYGKSVEKIEQKILEQFCEFISKSSISFISYTGDFRFACFEERKSVIAMCKVSNLESFSKSLGMGLGIEITLQPTHVTIYTLQKDVGIGLNSQAELDTKSVLIQVSEEIRKSLKI